MGRNGEVGEEYRGNVSSATTIFALLWQCRWWIPSCCRKGLTEQVVCCKSWARNTLESCYEQQNQDPSLSILLKSWHDVIYKAHGPERCNWVILKNCQSLIFHIASHLCGSAMGFMHVFHGVQQLQPCLSLSYRSSKFALCPAHGFQMIEKPVQQQQKQVRQGSRGGGRKEKGKKEREEGRNKERRVTGGRLQEGQEWSQ